MKFFKTKNICITTFIIFILFSLLASFNSFKKYFLNKGFNGDEYYLDNVYEFNKVNIEIITSLPSQFYLFLSSIFNIFINNPKFSTRAVSLFVLFLISFYFIIKIKRLKIDRFFKFQIFSILVLVLVFTKQCFVGTSDFISIFFLAVFIIELNAFFFQNVGLTKKRIFLLSLFLALSIVTRPTVLVILFVYSLTLLLILKKSIFINKGIFFIPILSIFFILLLNFGAIKNTGKIVFDVKEVPKSAGTNRLERNYLMAKFWDEGKIPTTKWLSSKEVVEYKKQNPLAYMPKSNLDLLINEPKLYLKQMVRMFLTANYTMFRYLNVLYLFAVLFVIIKNERIQTFFDNSNLFNQISLKTLKFTLILFYLSVFLFSFLAIKLFEFRWIIPIFIVLIWYILIIISKLKKNVAQIILITFYLIFTLWILKDYKIFLIN